MEEIFPILAGVVVGMLLGAVRPSMRLHIGIPLAVVFGVLATVLSGEFKVGWEYLLIDIPLVGIAAVATMLVTRYIARRVVIGDRWPHTMVAELRELVARRSEGKPGTATLESAARPASDRASVDGSAVECSFAESGRALSLVLEREAWHRVV